MLAVNLGTRGILPALDLLEYANHPSGTALSDLRIANGTPQPHNVRMWCLGNEMDGPWQQGFMTADDYGKLAARTAAAMKMADKDLELVVCGSSGSGMPTFGDWERTVLEHSYEHVDYVSCHAYYQELDGDLGSFLASALDMDYFIDTVVATADHVGHKKRRRRRCSFRSMNGMSGISRSTRSARRPPRSTRVVATRRACSRTSTTVADAVVVGNLLMTLLKHSDRVTSASLAQLVNVIAPIMTEPGGPAWRQTTFFPFSITSRLASGEVIRPVIEAPTYHTARHGEASLIDAVATADDGRAAVFLVNRDLRETAQVTIDVRSLGCRADHRGGHAGRRRRLREEHPRRAGPRNPGRERERGPRRRRAHHRAAACLVDGGRAELLAAPRWLGQGTKALVAWASDLLGSGYWRER